MRNISKISASLEAVARILGCIAAAILCVPLIACQDDLRIVQYQPVVDDCDLDRAVDQSALGSGTLDILLTNRYVAFPLLLNEHDEAIIIHSAILDFDTPRNISFALPSQVFFPLSGSIRPNGSAIVPVEIFSVDIGNIVRRAPEFFNSAEESFNTGALVTVSFNLTITGESVGGDTFESNTLSLPLDICVGCLLTYPEGTLFEDNNGSLTCDDPSNEGRLKAGDVPVPCFIGQEGDVDCRLCRALAVDEETADELCDPKEGQVTSAQETP